MTDILRDPTRSAPTAAIEANAVAMARARRAWPGLEMHDCPSLTWMATDVRCAIFNGVLAACLPANGTDAAIAAALAPFKARGLPMNWWIGPGSRPTDLARRLDAAGLAPAGAMRGMAADLAGLDDTRPVPDGLSVDDVRGDDMLHAWAEVTTECFEFPEFARRPWLDVHAAAGYGGDGRLRHFLGRLDGRAVAASTMYPAAGVAGIANVATLPTARRRGIATAVTLVSLLEARRRGYRFGTLAAAKGAEGLNRRLGFDRYCTLRVYLWAPD